MIDRDAVPHVVPVCFALSDDTLYITIDEKPKRGVGPPLKRLQNIAQNATVAIVVDRYEEDWGRLGWVMLRGEAEILTDGREHDHTSVGAGRPCRCCRRGRPRICCVFGQLIVGVEGGFKEEDCGGASGDVHYFAQFVGGEGATEEFLSL